MCSTSHYDSGELPKFQKTPKLITIPKRPSKSTLNKTLFHDSPSKHLQTHVIKQVIKSFPETSASPIPIILHRMDNPSFVERNKVNSARTDIFLLARKTSQLSFLLFSELGGNEEAGNKNISFWLISPRNYGKLVSL